MFNHLFLDIDAGTIDWSRAQFALTAIYHWLFVPLTLGLAVIMGIVETIYYRTKEQFWKDTAIFWQKLFGINFAMGVATGIILEFEFGTNWSNYSWFVGDIFGAPLAVEGIVAFFMESTFVAVMFFGWKKVSPGFHLASTWLTGLGATISAWWILVANAWMQYPVGCAFNPDTMRNEMVSFAEVALSPFAVSKFCHTVTSAWIIGAVFCVGVCCWYMMKRREPRLALESIKIGAAVGLVASLLAAATGHKSAQDVAAVQPMKLAAMEALYDGGNDIGLKVIEGIEVPNRRSSEASRPSLPLPPIGERSTKEPKTPSSTPSSPFSQRTCRISAMAISATSLRWCHPSPSTSGLSASWWVPAVCSSSSSPLCWQELTDGPSRCGATARLLDCLNGTTG